MDVSQFISSCKIKVNVEGDTYVSRTDIVAIMMKCRVPKAQAQKNADDYFNRFDPQATGYVDLNGFLKEYIRMGVFKAILKAKGDLTKYDTDGDGMISQQELLTMLKRTLGKNAGIEFVAKIFVDIDTDSSGSLSFSELNEWYGSYEEDVRKSQNEVINERKTENFQDVLARKQKFKTHHATDGLGIDVDVAADGENFSAAEVEDDGMRRCHRCGQNADPLIGDLTCNAHIGAKRMTDIQHCKKCGKDYPTFSPYQDGCTPCAHTFAQASQDETEEGDGKIMSLQFDESKAQALLVVETLEYIYDRLDASGEGLSKKQIQNGVTKLGDLAEKIDSAIINEMFQKGDTNSDGKITREEWIAFWNTTFNLDEASPQVLEQIRHAFAIVSKLDEQLYDVLMRIFKHLDTNSNGSLDIGEVTAGMKKGLSALGVSKADQVDQIKNFLLQCDGDNDKVITESEWVTYWESEFVNSHPSERELESLRSSFGLVDSETGFSAF